MLPAKPAILRTVVFIDGENLRKTCYALFGWGWCHPLLLAQELTDVKPDRVLVQCRYYTGVPDPNVDPTRAAKMTRRLNAYQQAGVHVVRRTLKYANEWRIANPPASSSSASIAIGTGGTASVAPGVTVQAQQVLVGREKGIDTRLALDLIRLAVDNVYDVAVVVSGDSDIDEAVQEVLDLRTALARWIAVENGVPVMPGRRYVRLASCTWATFIGKAMFTKVMDNAVYP